MSTILSAIVLFIVVMLLAAVSFEVGKQHDGFHECVIQHAEPPERFNFGRGLPLNY